MRNISFGIVFVGCMLVYIGAVGFDWLPIGPSKKILIPGIIIGLIGLALMILG